jgi:CheY-like chemotaxis protein
MRVLIIDDDEVFGHLLVELLADVGFGAICMADGIAAYESMTENAFDLCIIDQRMPLVLGADLAEAILHDHPRLKIILSSAFADQALRAYTVAKGMVLLSKPFTKAQLIEAVELALAEPFGNQRLS